MFCLCAENNLILEILYLDNSFHENIFRYFVMKLILKNGEKMFILENVLTFRKDKVIFFKIHDISKKNYSKLKTK